MKATIFSIFVLSLLFVSCTENAGVNKAFLKYGSEDGVTSITVPGFVIRLAASLADMTDEERELLRSIDKVKVLAIEDHKLNKVIDLHQEFYSNINKKGEFEELLTIRDKGENVTVFGKMEGEDIIKEMVVLVGGDDNALVYLKGHIDPDLLNEINFSKHGKLLSHDFK
jgi:hypothetical protein